MTSSSPSWTPIPIALGVTSVRPASVIVIVAVIDVVVAVVVVVDVIVLVVGLAEESVVNTGGRKSMMSPRK